MTSKPEMQKAAQPNVQSQDVNRHRDKLDKLAPGVSAAEVKPPVSAPG